MKFLSFTTNSSEHNINAIITSKCYWKGHDWSEEIEVKGELLTMTFADVCVEKKCVRCGLHLTSYRKYELKPVCWNIKYAKVEK